MLNTQNKPLFAGENCVIKKQPDVSLGTNFVEADFEVLVGRGIIKPKLT